MALSMRATNPDSYLAAQAQGLPRRRASLESVLAARPKVVVRYWGGEARMTKALERRGIAVVSIDDATTFDGVAGNVRQGRRGAWRGAGRRAAGGPNARAAGRQSRGVGRGTGPVSHLGGQTAGRGR